MALASPIRYLATKATLALFTITTSAAAQQASLNVGFMLPYSGTYSALGDMIEKGFRMYVC